MKQFLSCAKRVTVPFAVAALVALLLLSCIESPLEPIAPYYLSQISAPLFFKSWMTEEFVKKDSAQLKIDPVNNTFYVVKTQYPSPIQVDTLKVNPSLSSVNVNLGVFSIGTFSAPAENISATELGMSGSFPAGMPAGSFSARQLQINDTNQFDYASITSGLLTLTIVNNLQVPIDFPNSIVLMNNWPNPPDNNVVATFSITDTIAPGDSAVISDSVGGKFIRGLLATDSIRLHTSGSSGNVTINPTDGISFSFKSVQPMMSDSALAVIPRQNIPSYNDTAYQVDDSTKITDALFKSGNLGIYISTTLDVETKIRIEIPELSSNSLPIIDTLTESRPPLTKFIDFNGARLTPQNSSALIGTYLQYHVGITVISSNGSKKLVGRYDVVHADMQPGQTIVANYITGNIKPQHMQINASSRPEYGLKDANKFYAQLLLGGMKLIMRLDQPGGGFPYDFTGASLVARNSKLGTTVSLPITNGLVNPDISEPGQHEIDFSNEPGFSNFRDAITGSFPNLPDSFYVRGTAVVNPKSEFEKNFTHTVHDTTKVYPTLTMNIPSNIGIANGYVDEIYGISEIGDSATIANVADGTLNLECTNRIPLKIISRMSFLKWNSAQRRNDTLPVVIPADTIVGADYSTGTSTSSEHVSRFSIKLLGSDMDLINQADSVRIRLNLETSNNGTVVPVMIRVDDYVKIRASAVARIYVNK